jgi:hypothetical protein
MNDLDLEEHLLKPQFYEPTILSPTSLYPHRKAPAHHQNNPSFRSPFPTHLTHLIQSQKNSPSQLTPRDTSKPSSQQNEHTQQSYSSLCLSTNARPKSIHPIHPGSVHSNELYVFPFLMTHTHPIKYSPHVYLSNHRIPQCFNDPTTPVHTPPHHSKRVVSYRKRTSE